MNVNPFAFNAAMVNSDVNGVAIHRQAGWHFSKRLIAKRHHVERDCCGVLRPCSQGLA